MQAAAHTQSQTQLTAQQPKGVLYWALLILSFYGIFNFVLRNTIGLLPHASGIIGAWKEIIVGILYLLWFMKAKAEGSFKVNKSPLHWAILVSFVAFVVAVSVRALFPASISVAGIATIVPPTLVTTIDGLRVIFEPMLYFFVLVQLIETEETLNMMIHGMLISATTVAAYGVLQRLMGVESPPSWTYSDFESGIKLRVFSTIGNPNGLGGYMVLMTPIAVSFMLWAKQWKERIIYAVMSLILLACLVLTYSRGAWIGFAAAIVIYALVIRNKKLMILFVVGTAVFLLIFKDSILNRLLFAFSDTYMAKSANSGRLAFWARAFEIWKDYPVFGGGVGVVGDSVAVRHKMPGATWIDNQYVKVLAETGLIGILTYLTMLFTPVVQGWKYIFSREEKGTFLYKLNAGILAAIFGMMVENVTAAIWEDINVVTHFWVLIAMLYVSIRIGAKHTRAVK